MGAAPQLQDCDVIVAFDLAHADRTPELGGPVEITNGQDGMADPHGRTMLHRLEVSHFVAGAEQLRVTPGRPVWEGGRPGVTPAHGRIGGTPAARAQFHVARAERPACAGKSPIRGEVAAMDSSCRARSGKMPA